MVSRDLLKEAGVNAASMMSTSLAAGMLKGKSVSYPVSNLSAITA